MQVKRFAQENEKTLGSGIATFIEISQNAERKANFHGIRWSGRLKADQVSADNEAHGLLMLTCRTTAFGDLLSNDVNSDAELENLSEIIVATLPWAVFGGSTTLSGAGTIFDWDIVINTSRTCTKGMSLRANTFSDAGSAKSIIIMNQLLSCFETIV